MEAAKAQRRLHDDRVFIPEKHVRGRKRNNWEAPDSEGKAANKKEVKNRNKSRSKNRG